MGALANRQQSPFAGEVHQRLLQLLEGADLDLADALAADVIDLGELLQGLGIVAQTPLGQDVTFAVIEGIAALKDAVALLSCNVR